MPRRLHLLALLLCGLGAATFACRSADKPESEAKADAENGEAGTDGQAKAALAEPKPQDCAKGANLSACCEALTPACNDCRDKNKKAQKAWDAACLAPADQDPDCKKDPPVIACCSEPNEACQDCREAAFTALMSWKERCAAAEQLRCDRAPPQSECCAAGTPACEACAARNRRMRDEWRVKCGRDEG